MKNMSPKSHLFGRLNMRFIPLLVWLVAVIAVVVLFSHRTRRFEVLGIAQSEINQIAANCAGRLKNLNVELFDEVKQGQKLAVVDTILDNEQLLHNQLKAQLDTISAEMQHLVAESNAAHRANMATIDNRISGWVADQRAFANDVMRAKLRTLELTALIETDQLIAKQLDLDIKRLLVDYRLDVNDALVYNLKKMRLEYDTLNKKIQENQRLLAQSRQDMENALNRQDEFVRNNKPHPGSSDDEVQHVALKALDILESRMDESRVQREALASRQAVELTAPFDGVVSQVLHRVGEPVLAGEPILTITKKQPTEIAGYANKKQINLIQKEMAVELIKTREQPQIAIAQVIYVGPEMVQIPQQLWRNPNIPEWGRPFLIQVPSGFEVIPGESVGIRGL